MTQFLLKKIYQHLNSITENSKFNKIYKVKHYFYFKIIDNVITQIYLRNNNYMCLYYQYQIKKFQMRF